MQEELQKLKEEFDQRIKELEGKYKSEEEWPRYGEYYWTINDKGETNYYFWSGDDYDKTILNNNALFKTGEEAEFEAERLKVLRELEKLGSPFDFKSSNWFIYLTFDSEIDCFSRSGFNCAYGDYYFRSYVEAKEAIKTIGEDRIRKYLFRVED